ncbi:thiamine pyrophosphate-dependent dehydrogenase E1 component subunit alpha [Nocardioides immobilis]|uniref:Thiamine pyrophosphate-dependent dehydrogenase E1 component subunit alpha n=1 Tax=Nocardioides immobilis TaxID=2049295 RepID=A0A417XXH6_9ACTN|nr:thiamine pyrophosphate-dependent dehydrogenase E1 component subunit alpha [Nocardioides immobilis]RHW24950.1 thiamine pyrophosphate-dependent dehydrogenase E1 component subunit alpha [Nocardioides immobilis]
MGAPSGDDLLRLYELMVESRAFDDACMDLLAAGEEVPHFHSGAGQEALSIGSVAMLRPTDEIVYTHRGYAHLLAKGVPLATIAADMFYRRGGTNGARGGVMHVSRPDLGVPGREGVFGTRFGLAAGLALAHSLRGDDGVAVCFYGEAAGARGPLYEALNMAVLWNLPVVFVAENNGWSVNSRTEWLFPGGRMSTVWSGFGIPVTEVDGNDLTAVSSATARAVSRARAGGGPSVIEGLTYRLHPHIWWDDASYVPARELQAWWEKDPIPRQRRVLEEEGMAADRLDDVERRARNRVAETIEAVRGAPFVEWDLEVGVEGVR